MLSSSWHLPSRLRRLLLPTRTSTTPPRPANNTTRRERRLFHGIGPYRSRVYATEAAIDADQAIDKAGDDWDDIGEVNNLIVSRDGSVKAAVVGVGGFLGLGEKNVALRLGELKFLKKVGDDANDYFIVVSSNKESLEKAPEYEPAN